MSAYAAPVRRNMHKGKIATPPASSPFASASRLLQRKCACSHTVGDASCEACGKKRPIQAKLTVGASDDALEREADRVADHVLSGAGGVVGGSARPQIQRYAGASSDRRDSAPPSVEQVLSGSGRPLERSLQQDMGQRFGYDFSRVKVHTGADAAQSAQDVQARAYTIGQHVVFGAGQYAPGSSEGRRLLAHELTHVVQQQYETDAPVRRDTKPSSNAPAQSVDPLRALLPQIPPEISKQFSVRAIKESEFQALTGTKASSIPEKRLLSPAEAGLSPDLNAGALTGISAGVLAGPRPGLPLPVGTMGVIWSAGAHLSQFAVVPQENPVIAFFFGDSTMSVYGFRANALLHARSAIERIPNSGGGSATARLNAGAPGNYVNDAIFPYLPVKGGAVAVHVQGGAENIPGAQELVDCMAETSRSGQLKGTYTFSPPTPGTPAYERAFGTGAPPETNNCLNKANELTRMALQGRDLVMPVNGRQVNISTATYVDTGEPVPGMLPSAAKNVGPYLSQWDTNPSAQGLSRTPITGGLVLNGVTGVIRIGGFVLMIFNLARIKDRYDQASEYDKPLVAGEEATLLTAGLLGSLIGEVIGEAVLCLGTGPGAGLCVLAAGIGGGAAAAVMSGDTARSMGESLQVAAELHRQGKLLPAVTEATTQAFGTEQQKKIFHEMKKVERTEPSDGLFDLFNW